MSGLALTEPCIPWTGKLTKGGYAQLWWKGSHWSAHRLAYFKEFGPIPDGMHIDHVCHSADLDCPGGDVCSHRACVNPRHLEPVLPRVNMLRGRGPTAENAKKTACPSGHPFTPDNTKIVSGRRTCCICRQAQQTAYRARIAKGPRPLVTHCIKGHELAGANLHLINGDPRRRICCECRRRRSSEYKARRRLARAS